MNVLASRHSNPLRTITIVALLLAGLVGTAEAETMQLRLKRTASNGVWSHSFGQPSFRGCKIDGVTTYDAAIPAGRTWNRNPFVVSVDASYANRGVSSQCANKHRRMFKAEIQIQLAKRGSGFRTVKRCTEYFPQWAARKTCRYNAAGLNPASFARGGKLRVKIRVTHNRFKLSQLSRASDEDESVCYRALHKCKSGSGMTLKFRMKATASAKARTSAKSTRSSGGRDASHVLPRGSYRIINQYGCPGHRYCGWQLSWDSRPGTHPRASVEKNDPVAWQLVPVRGKTNVYRIRNTYGCPSHRQCGWELSWDNAKNHPMASVEKNDPVEWKLVPVRGKRDTFHIVNTFGCPTHKHCGAQLSWDKGKQHPMASVEKNYPVQWKIVRR